MKSGDPVATGTGATRRRLTVEEAEAGGLSERFTREEWTAMHDATKPTYLPCADNNVHFDRGDGTTRPRDLYAMATGDISNPRITPSSMYDAATDPFIHPVDRLNMLLKERDALRAQIARMQPVVDAAEALRSSALTLYMAGTWTAGGNLEEEAEMWRALRDALGLEPGAATALGVGSVKEDGQ